MVSVPSPGAYGQITSVRDSEWQDTALPQGQHLRVRRVRVVSLPRHGQSTSVRDSEWQDTCAAHRVRICGFARRLGRVIVARTGCRRPGLGHGLLLDCAWAAHRDSFGRIQVSPRSHPLRASCTKVEAQRAGGTSARGDSCASWESLSCASFLKCFVFPCSLL